MHTHTKARNTNAASCMPCLCVLSPCTSSSCRKLRNACKYIMHVQHHAITHTNMVRWSYLQMKCLCSSVLHVSVRYSRFFCIETSNSDGILLGSGAKALRRCPAIHELGQNNAQHTHNSSDREFNTFNTCMQPLFRTDEQEMRQTCLGMLAVDSTHLAQDVANHHLHT